MDNPAETYESYLVPALCSIILLVSALTISNCTPPIRTATPDNAVSDQYEITQTDNGRTFVYPETTRFTVILNANQYPPDELDCQPEGIIGSISNVPDAQAPLVASRFEALQPGECILQDRDFLVRIRVVN